MSFTTCSHGLFYSIAVLVAKTPEQFTYDADGNMTSDGRFHYTWNGENRLICASNAEVVVTYAYDHRGRMVTKTLCSSAPLRLIKSTTYLWDDWNIIREIVRKGDSVAVTDNIWGLDLDGTLQGAGGVGGLLAVVRHNSSTPNFSIPQLYFPTYDANGNISEYVSESGEIVAHYDYSPFGEPLVASGPLAPTFTHQFSTKPYCSVTGFSEYQMRKYRPEIGRWMSRDPIEEESSRNLYAIVHNMITLSTDNLGMIDCKKCCKAKMCHWTGTISGNLLIPIFVGGWANMSINAIGVSDEAPTCFWTIVGKGRRWIPGGGLAVGWIKGAVSINMDAPCEWPVAEDQEGVISWVGAGGTVAIPVNLAWTIGIVGSLNGTDLFGVGGVNVFVGGGAFMTIMKIKRGKGCF